MFHQSIPGKRWSGYGGPSVPRSRTLCSDIPPNSLQINVSATVIITVMKFSSPRDGLLMFLKPQGAHHLASHHSGTQTGAGILSH